MAINAALIGARGTSSGSSATTTAGTSTGGSGSIFLIFCSFDPSTTVSTVADSKSNTYSALGAQVTGQGRIRAYKCEGGTGGSSHTATVTFSGTAYPTVHLIEVTGAATSSPQDVYVTSNSDSTTPWTLASGTLAQAAEVLLYMLEQNSGTSGNYSVSGGIGSMLSQEPDVDNLWTSAVSKYVSSATTSQTQSWTRTNSANAASAQLVVSFKEAAAAGLVVNPFRGRGGGAAIPA